jgi:23S rRNA (pseudouridine1915-N3)-methyltransferase
MKFFFFFLGKTREKYLDQGFQDYTKRLRRFADVQPVVLKERHLANADDERIKLNECDLLLERSANCELRIALDPRGRALDSLELAQEISAWEERGVRAIALLIGGHLGLHPKALEAADFVLSLSRMTFTHEMTRLILIEQLYRACTIRAGHKYHK